jgi:hypothetical protein
MLMVRMRERSSRFLWPCSAWPGCLARSCSTLRGHAPVAHPAAHRRLQLRRGVDTVSGRAQLGRLAGGPGVEGSIPPSLHPSFRSRPPCFIAFSLRWKDRKDECSGNAGRGTQPHCPLCRYARRATPRPSLRSFQPAPTATKQAVLCGRMDGETERPNSPRRPNAPVSGLRTGERPRLCDARLVPRVTLVSDLTCAFDPQADPRNVAMVRPPPRVLGPARPPPWLGPRRPRRGLAGGGLAGGIGRPRQRVLD